jgi:4-hydroxybenzoate polyprenyltransferase
LSVASSYQSQAPHAPLARAADPLVPPAPADLPAAIAALRRERNAVILAHYYQDDAIQDIDEDASAGIVTTAVKFGVKGSLIWSGSWWIVSTVAFALVNIPVAVVSGLISGWLLFANWKTPTSAEAKRLYKFSVAFPYVAGAVAGVQLVTGITLGLYP